MCCPTLYLPGIGTGVWANSSFPGTLSWVFRWSFEHPWGEGSEAKPVSTRVFWIHTLYGATGSVTYRLNTQGFQEDSTKQSIHGSHMQVASPASVCEVGRVEAKMLLGCRQVQVLHRWATGDSRESEVTNIAAKHSIVAFLLHFSVAVATHLSLASHTTCFTKPHSQRDVGPSWAGSNIVCVIRECYGTWALLSKLRPY
jgi:hypothetical protein